MQIPHIEKVLADMKLFWRAAALTAVLSLSSFATEWKIDSAHSSANFGVKHLMVSTVHGTFSAVQGTVSYDPANPAAISIKAVIETNTVDTREPDRDKHLKSPDFFDVAKYPTITFVSKRVVPGAAGKISIIGDLTIRGVTKEVMLEVDGPTAAVKDPWGNNRVGATATTTLNRKDFGVAWNKSLDSGGMVLGDDVSVSLELELTQAK
jgi:polyisoprenoid-binding protein YceI